MSVTEARLVFEALANGRAVTLQHAEQLIAWVASTSEANASAAYQAFTAVPTKPIRDAED